MLYCKSYCNYKQSHEKTWVVVLLEICSFGLSTSSTVHLKSNWLLCPVFQGVYILPHRLQHVLQVALAHRRVVGAANLGDTARAGFALALVHTNKWKCSFAHDIVSLSLLNGYAQKMRLMIGSTALLLSFPGEPPSLR